MKERETYEDEFFIRTEGRSTVVNAGRDATNYVQHFGARPVFVVALAIVIAIVILEGLAIFDLHLQVHARKLAYNELFEQYKTLLLSGGGGG